MDFITSAGFIVILLAVTLVASIVNIIFSFRKSKDANVVKAVSELKVTPKGFVNKLHLIYIVIILSLVIVCIITITSWPDATAGAALNNAATAVSIVLALVDIYRQLQVSWGN